MDSTRALKRRKIEHSQSSAKKGLAPPGEHKNTASSTTGSEDAKTQDVASRSAQAAWRLAKKQVSSHKAKRHPGRSKKQEMGLRNDIKGAHGELEKNQVTRSVGKLQPAAKPLDPLRNQRYDSSPAKVQSTPTKGTGALGFFKQFHLPRQELDESQEQTSDGNEDSENITLAGAADKTQNGGNGDELAEDVPVRPRGRPRRAEGPPNRDVNTSEQEPRRRTFEEEIKELEEKARDEAEAEVGAEDEEAVIPSKRGVRLARENHKVLGTQRPLKESKQRHRNGHASASLDRRKLQPASETPSTNSVANIATGLHNDNGVEMDTSDAQINHSAPTTPSKSATTFVESVSATVTAPSTFSPSVTLGSRQLQTVQHIVLEKATGKRQIPITNLSEPLAKVSSLIEQTISAGESNSMLLIGARGSGKTALVNAILQDQAREHKDEFYIVRLNGFIHTDDKIALREIWRQLGRDMGVLEEHENSARNYADTLATLLALLSHPAETGQEQPEGHAYKSVIFILDEFDLFAHHPRQTLLYNLFDIAQSRKAPIAVLGLTTRIDVTEALEKRVKSRFSHRYVHLGLAKSFSAFCDVVRAALSISEQDSNVNDIAKLGAETRIASKLAKASSSTHIEDTQSAESWNAMIDALMANDAFENHLRRIYFTTKSIPDVLSTLLIPLATIPTDAPANGETITNHIISSLTTNALKSPDSKLALLSSLSTLHLALLICAARLTNIHNADTVSFALAYEEYKVLASKAKLQATASGMAGPGAGARVWGKEVARGAWGELLETGLVIEDGRSGAGSGRVDVGLEEIGVLGSGGGVDLGGWGRWCREI